MYLYGGHLFQPFWTKKTQPGRQEGPKTAKMGVFWYLQKYPILAVFGPSCRPGWIFLVQNGWKRCPPYRYMFHGLAPLGGLLGPNIQFSSFDFLCNLARRISSGCPTSLSIRCKIYIGAPWKSLKSIIWFTIEAQYELQLLASLYFSGQSCSHPNLLHQASLSESVQRQHHKVHKMIVYCPTQLFCTLIFICCCVPW